MSRLLLWLMLTMLLLYVASAMTACRTEADCPPPRICAETPMHVACTLSDPCTAYSSQCP